MAVQSFMECTKNILITGASGGLGTALALHYATANNHLFLTGRDALKLENTAKLCRLQGGKVSIKKLDIRQPEDLDRWLLSVDEQSPFDLVFANAGASSSLGPNDEGEHIQDVIKILQVNTLGAIATVNSLANRMRKRRQGHIVLISSISGLYGFPSTPSYSASKAALRVYGQSLTGWLCKYGVRVSVVTMGFVQSEMSRRYKGAQPFSIDAKSAARKIATGVAGNKNSIVFPGILAFGVATLKVLPAPLAGYIVKRFFSCQVIPDQDSPLWSDDVL